MKRMQCSPVIFGFLGLIVLAILAAHYRHAVLTAMVITAMCLLCCLVLYTAGSVMVAYRRHKRAVAVQSPPAPTSAPSSKEPMSALPPTAADTADPDRLPERDHDLSDLNAATGVTADGRIV